MIQETYKISVLREGDVSDILQRFGTLLEEVRRSSSYLGAKSVYAKLLMAQIPMTEAECLCNMAIEGLPKAEIAGMSMTLTTQDTDAAYLLASFCFFDHAQVTVLWHDGDPADYMAAGRMLGHRIACMEHVRGVELFCVVLNIDVAPFVLGLSEENPEVPFFGSMAGMNYKPDYAGTAEGVFDQENINIIYTKKLPVECCVLGNGFYRSGIVMVLFTGEDLHVQADYLLGWKPLGKELTITEAPTNVCAATIDGIPATEIFRKYLNVLPDSRFLMNICEFPMILERDGCLLARTPPVFDHWGRLYFSADIREGEKFRLSYANPREFLLETRMASGSMWEFHPQGLFLVACPSRAIFLGEDAPQEIEAYHRLQPHLAVSYGPGEIYRYQGRGGALNCSLLAIGMREGPCPQIPVIPELSTEGSGCAPIPLSTRLAAFLDATTKELKEANEDLRRMAETARAASRAKSQFLSNMSHEIRTPINAVLGMDEMILREAQDETILEYAENIRTAGSNLLGIINDILDFSKIESGKIDIIPVEYALSSVLNDLVNMIGNRAEKKGLCLAVTSEENLPSILWGDEIRIKQIVTNLLTNAVKYTERGFVSLSVGFEKTGEDTVLLKVSVSDTGIGIKEEDLNRLFDAFERIEERRNRSIEGTGLGMNITKRLLALMDSHLEVKSIYGKGSTFSFALEQKVISWKPMGDFDEAYRRSFAQRREYSEKFVAPEARILVVDDTAMNLTVVKGLLKQTRVQIDTAKSGYECLHLVETKTYDIIFLDHRMPGMDGIETLKAMKALPGNRNKETPVISLTANAVSGAREEYIAAGFIDYLTKPINSVHLEMLMLKYLPPEKVSCDERKEEPLPPPQKTSFPEWLKQVPGINTSEGIIHCGSAENYLEAVHIFAESIVPSAKEIARYYETEDWENFTTKVHALKSTARVIGAQELSNRAKMLEDAGNRNDINTIRACSDDLLQLYLTYAFHFAPLCKTEEKKDRPLIDDATLAEAYDALREVAASFDYDSVMFILHSLEEYTLPEADEKRCRELLEASGKPDWDRVMELLQE